MQLPETHKIIPNYYRPRIRPYFTVLLKPDNHCWKSEFPVFFLQKSLCSNSFVLYHKFFFFFNDVIIIIDNLLLLYIVTQASALQVGI